MACCTLVINNYKSETILTLYTFSPCWEMYESLFLFHLLIYIEIILLCCLNIAVWEIINDNISTF